MANIAVKGVSAFFDVAVSAKANVQADNNSDSFDKTLNGMRTEKTERNNGFDNGSYQNIVKSKSEKFKTLNRKEQVKPEEDITDEQMAMVSEEITSQMKEILMEKYNISEEQLIATIESAGLTEESLLDVQSLIQIVMKLEGMENQTDMLTNSDFGKNLKEILTQLEDLKNEQVTGDIIVDDSQVNVVEDSIDVEDNDVVAENTQMSPQDTLDEGVVVKEENFDSMPKQNDKQNDSSDTKETITDINVNPQDFVQKLTEDLSAKVGEIKASDIVRQVVEQTQLQVKQGVTSIEMQLYPEHLGKVLVQVASNEGSITAQITAESEAAKAALESQLTLLKEELINQGVKVENVEVTIASHAFEQNMQGEADGEQSFAQNKRSRRNTDMFFEDASDEDVTEIEQNIMELRGSTVSYSA